MTATTITARSAGIAVPSVPLERRSLVGLTLAAIAVVAVLHLATSAGPESRDRGVAPAAEHGTLGLEAVPEAARPLVAQALGRGDRAYHVGRASSGLLTATNRPHRLTASFSSAGVQVRSGPARLGLALRAVGYGDVRRTVAAARPVASANRVAYRRGALTEWYANGPLGLEQGFTLRSRPSRPRTGPLTLELGLSGTLSASLERGRRGLRLEGAGGSLRYSGLLATDARGHELRAWLEPRGRRLLVRIDDRRARYPVEVDPFVQQAQLTASDGAAGDLLGSSVAISGDTIVVGAPGQEVSAGTQGAVYVFVKSAGGWTSGTETAKLTASDGSVGDRLGASVAVAGDTIVAGAPGDQDNSEENDLGSAYVFVEPAGGWANGIETAKLVTSDRGVFDRLGASVAVAGDTIVVGAPNNLIPTGAGFAEGSLYVFVEPAAGWASGTETARLTASDGSVRDRLGASVAVAGDTIVAGAPGDRDNSEEHDLGSAYVFVKPAGGWANGTETAKLLASDRSVGDRLGASVAIADDTIVVGAPNNLIPTGAGFAEGSAYVFGPAAPSQHYLLYQLGQPEAAGETVTLVDRFGTLTVRLEEAEWLLNPAEKRRAGHDPEQIQQPEDHLVCYGLPYISTAERSVVVRNQFGESTLRIGRPLTLCTPAAKSLSGDPGPPPQDLDHFLCYDVRGETPLFPSETLDVSDQLGSRTVRIDRARVFCTPAEKRREGRPPEPIIRPDERIVCYRITTQSPAFGGANVVANDQFSSLQALRVRTLERLCAPSSEQ